MSDIRFCKPVAVFVLGFFAYQSAMCTISVEHISTPAPLRLTLFLSNLIFHNIISPSSHPSGGFTFYELMQRGVPLHLINQYMNETKILEQEK